MKTNIKTIGITLASAITVTSALAAGVGESGDVVRLGVLNDRSGPYADMGGVGSEVAVRLAVADFGGKVLGKTIEVVGGDGQGKPDVASSLARNWFDTRNVVALVDGGGSAPGLAMLQVAETKNGTMLNTGGFAEAFSGERCSENSTSWPPDTYAFANAAVSGITSQSKGNKWYLIAPDYVFGKSLIDISSAAIKKSGDTVVSTTFHPLNTMDFSSYLLRAQSSGANTVGVASAGGDLINLLKQAGEFGLTSDKKLKLVPYVIEITDVKSMGLARAQGLTFATMAYWDQNDATRAWTSRWQSLGKFALPPTSQHLTSYIATMHYLEAVKAAGTFDGKIVNRKMREIPVKTEMLKNARLRPEDGRVIYDMLQVVVKSPAESKGPNDLYKVVGTIPRDKSFRSLAESKCPLVKS